MFVLGIPSQLQISIKQKQFLKSDFDFNHQQKKKRKKVLLGMPTDILIPVISHSSSNYFILFIYCKGKEKNISKNYTGKLVR